MEQFSPSERPHRPIATPVASKAGGSDAPDDFKEPIPGNIMDLLVEKYTRFAQLMARGKLQRTDIASVRAICNQVEASAVELENEAQKRRWIVEQIRKSIEQFARIKTEAANRSASQRGA
ncbi:MAG: hypothetical protein AAF752_03135 [Bacteroidota bacterium]